MPDRDPADGFSWTRLAGSARQLSSHRFWTSTKGVLTGLAAIATVVSVALKVIPTSEACASNTAALSNPHIGAGTLENYLERTSSDPDPTKGFPKDKLAERVTWASVAVSVVGHKGKYLTLKWSMVDATSRQSDGLQANRVAVDFKPPGCERNAFREEVLLPTIPRGRVVYVTFDLVDESNERLPPHEVRTDVFGGTP